MSVRIHQGGREYTIVGRTLADVRAEIEQGIASGAPHWLQAKSGEGRPSDALLLVTAGTDIALVAEEDGDPAWFDEDDTVVEDELLA